MIRVIHSVSIMNRAGQETFLMNTYRRLNREKIQFDFQCSEKAEGDYNSEIREMGGNLFYLGDNKIKMPYLKYIGAIIQQYRFFKEHQEYDIFHIHTYHAFDAWLSIVGAKMAGMKHIILHSHSTSGMHVRLHKIFRNILSVMNIERFACSQTAAEWMFGKTAVQNHKVHIVKNGIVPENFTFSESGRMQKRKTLNIDNKIVVGHVGRLELPKNHEFLIDIFEEFVRIEKNAILLLVGEGSLHKDIETKVKKMGLQDKVMFLGVRQDINELLWAMDIFVFPSIYEGLGIAAIEAQAAGVPCLLSNRISEECKVTDNVEFCPLENPDIWIRQMTKNCRKGHRNNEMDINRAGYNINETVRFLEKKYVDITSEKRR